jgi:hypothetical protein
VAFSAGGRESPELPSADIVRRDNAGRNESPGRLVWGATGAGLGYSLGEVERKCRFCFDNGAIVRFRYCDISAMTLLRQHISQRFSVGIEAPARIQPEMERTLAFASWRRGGPVWAKPFFCFHVGPRS